MPMPIETGCAIAGGGPAGLMLGCLLARAGIDTVVLEKHGDFLRDFRGDTIHPSTMQVMHELGILADFLRLPHQKVHQLTAQFGAQRLTLASFGGLPVEAPYIAMMPQWDFLDFLATRARAYPNFRILMPMEARGLIRTGERVTGVVANGPGGTVEVRAPLVVAADGRGSTLRDAAGLELTDLGAPMDVLWFRLSRKETDTPETQARFDVGRIFIMLNRGDYWQCAYVIPKGANERVRSAGLPAFRAGLAALLPFDASRAEEIADWEQAKLLTVQVNRLEKWWLPGFICIGDAAHAMSPVGGVGVNLAVQDAVAAANRLVGPLRSGMVGDTDLAAIQSRREWPTKATQWLQVLVQQRIIETTLAGTREIRPPTALRILTSVPFLRRLPARLIGLGLRPEHVAIDGLR